MLYFKENLTKRPGCYGVSKERLTDFVMYKQVALNWKTFYKNGSYTDQYELGFVCFMPSRQYR